MWNRGRKYTNSHHPRVEALHDAERLSHALARCRWLAVCLQPTCLSHPLACPEFQQSLRSEKGGEGRKKKKKEKRRNKYRKSTSEKFVLGRVDPHHMAIRCSCVRTPVSGCKSAGSSVGNSGGSVASVSVSVSVNGHTGRGGHAP